MLKILFEVWGARLHEFGNGIDNSAVIEKYETRSMGRDTTFEEDAAMKSRYFKSLMD